MIDHLRIKNFKAWRDTGDIALAPITIFFGTNSSGKSSLAQALLLLQQTAQSSDRRRILHLGDHNSTIDLGTFADIVHGHAEDQAIRFELGWRAPSPVHVKDSRSERELEGRSLSFATTIDQRGGKLLPPPTRFYGFPDEAVA